MGIKRVTMLTGDRSEVANRVAGELGCTDYKAQCLPQDKLAVVEQIKKDGHTVVVVGDGINDAPALAAGDLGIAMGAAGSDVAINSASIALMNDDLRRIPFLVDVSRKTRRVINQNLAFGVVFIVLGISLSKFVPPAWPRSCTSPAPWWWSSTVPGCSARARSWTGAADATRRDWRRSRRTRRRVVWDPSPCR